VIDFYFLKGSLMTWFIWNDMADLLYVG